MEYKLYLIRHGESTGNLVRQIQSLLDTDLTENGYKQAKQLRGQIQVDFVYHSPLRRAAETARTAFGGIDGTTLVEVDRLKEEDVGIFVGKLWPELTDEELKIWEEFRNNPDFKGHGGESSAEANKRAVDVMLEIIDDMKQRSVTEAVVISHGGIFSRFMRQKLGMEDVHLENCSIHPVQFSETTRKWNIFE